ncbi:MarR family winged helix-turn-helix transcriptional regulator [Arthrobacter sp. H35-D1]|uniref:MarR family winged helix-turn-helix transcriptional regulator n=1 Tax=Arthrobacter sp. H35-D1 TaxID=3046202 RepID=UPI0024BAC5AB|nr:MarR family winged helix-turn-helix transcriptional regulator [Arthrobacter sp. H35-D1]MDJ0313677.1 MarR family winged helix-turn-helix transcriptional regulator [Arthrobacter sp. H35-D1]
MINNNDASEILSEMVQISRTFRVAGQRSREQSLAGTKLGFLQHLRRSDARLGELAHRLFVSAPVATRTVEALEADGMVERRTDPQDARAFLISITGRGRVKLDENESHAVHQFAEALADWSPADAGQAIRILERLNGHLIEVLQAPDAAESGRAGTSATPENGSEHNG